MATELAKAQVSAVGDMPPPSNFGLVPPADGGDYAGAYWTGTEMAVVEDLGPDQEEAIDEFRAYLQEHDET